MARDKGNAGDWTYGDMLRNEAELNDANIEFYVEFTTVFSAEDAKRGLTYLAEQAKKKGFVLGTKEDSRGNVTVTLESRNPNYRGKPGRGKTVNRKKK